MKKIMNFSAITFMMLAFLGISTVNAQEWTKDQQAVWNEVEKMWSNWKAGDFDAAFANLDDRYLGWNNTDPMPISKSKWVDPMKEDKDKYSNLGFDIEPTRILVIDDAAVVFYYYSMWWVYNDGDKKTNGNLSGRWTEFFIKEKGNWTCIGDFTYTKPDKGND